MLEGTIKFYRADKKYGFIIPSDGSKEVYVHASQLQDTVIDGDVVLYELQPDRQGHVALQVRLRTPPAPEADVTA